MSWVRLPRKPEFFFKLCLHCRSSSVHNYNDHSHLCSFKYADQIYDSQQSHAFFFYSDIFSSNPQEWPVPSWLASSVGGALHRYRRGHAFYSGTSLFSFFFLIFQAFFSLLLNCVALTVAMIFYIFSVTVVTSHWVPFDPTVVTSF